MTVQNKLTHNKEDSKENQSSMVDLVINVRRVTKVTKGGKRFTFSALVVSGDQCGKVGIGLGKSREAVSAIAKATNRARKHLISIPLRGSTLPYPVLGKHCSSRVLLRSASKGTGMIAGGAVRAIMEVLGVKDVLAKSMGSSNRVNVVKATLNALAHMRSASHISKLRGKTVEQITKGIDYVSIK